MTVDQEQEIVRHYCLQRKLYRPKTDVWTLLIFVLRIGILSGVFALLVLLLIGCMQEEGIDWSGLQAPVDSHLYIVECVFFAGYLLNMRKLLILLISVYQRYAPERIRRKCICLPTCSEYAIIVLYKYNVIKALHKIIHRLTRECTGQIYHIDLP